MWRLPNVPGWRSGFEQRRSWSPPGYGVTASDRVAGGREEELDGQQAGVERNVLVARAGRGDELPHRAAVETIRLPGNRRQLARSREHAQRGKRVRHPRQGIAQDRKPARLVRRRDVDQEVHARQEGSVDGLREVARSDEENVRMRS